MAGALRQCIRAVTVDPGVVGTDPHGLGGCQNDPLAGQKIDDIGVPVVGAAIADLVGNQKIRQHSPVIRRRRYDGLVNEANVVRDVERKVREKTTPALIVGLVLCFPDLLNRGLWLMRTPVGCALLIAALLSAVNTIGARHLPFPPDLQGTWNGSTRTPLQRPAAFRDRAAFTPEEAAEYLRGTEDRVRSRLPSLADRQMQIDIGDAFVEVEQMPLDGLRTSLIIDPPDGMLPPLLPAATARISERPKRTFEDPETFGLAERCLLGNFGASGGSAASPPMLPSQVIPSFYRIVQTDTHVLIFTEWVHDARVIRLNGVHRPATIRSWLGDSIGHYDGSTLVVDTTNFRRDTHNLDSGERLHVVERFTRVDAKTLRYRVTVDDPDTWATAWTAEWPFRASAAAPFSVECHEGNYAIENFLRGARAEERRAQPVRR